MKLESIPYRLVEIEQVISNGLYLNRTLAEIAEEIAKLEPTHCPYDCDGCHDYDCPCDRLGCAGSGVELH